MAGKIITDFIKMQLFKKGGAIASDKAVKFSADALEKRLINLGINPNTINTQTELKQLLAYIKQAEDQAFNQMYSGILSGDEAAKFLNKAFPKKGEVIPFPQKRTFSEEIEAMKKSGDLVDEKDMVISEKITDREMFKNANERFNPPPGSRGGEDDIAAPFQSSEETLKSMFEAENKKNIAKIKERKKMLDDSIDDASPGFSGDRKTDAELVAENLAERRGLVYDDLPTKERLKIYDEAYQGLVKKKNIPEDFAVGGRAGHYTGGMVDVEPNLSDIGHGSDALMARTRVVSPGSQATTSTGLNYLLAEDNDNIRVPFRVGKTAKKKKKKKQRGPSPFEMMVMVPPEIAFREPVNFPYKSLEDIPPNVLEMLRRDPNFDLETFLTKVGWSDPDKTRIQEKMKGKVSAGVYKDKEDEAWGLYSPRADMSFLNYQQFGKNEPIGDGLLSIKSPTDADKVQTILHEMRHAKMKEPWFRNSSAIPEYVRKTDQPDYSYQKYGMDHPHKFVGGEELFVRFMDQYFGDVAEKGTLAGSDYKPYFDKILYDHWRPYAKRYEEILNEEKRVKERVKGGAYGLAEGGRIGFKEGNGVYDEEKEKELLGKRVRELMDDGFDFAEAIKEAMKEGYAKGGRIGFSTGKLAGGIESAIGENKTLQEEIEENEMISKFLAAKDKKMQLKKDLLNSPEGVLMDPPFYEQMPKRGTTIIPNMTHPDRYNKFNAPYIVFDDGTIFYPPTGSSGGEFIDGNTGETVDGPSPNAKPVNTKEVEAAEGGRIGFKSGTDFKKRAFLKLLAALTGGIAGIKSGILGLGESGTKKAVTETIKKTATPDVPPYFFKLVDKIRALGDDTLASQDKAIAKKYKDYVMEEDFAGNITIIKKNMDEMYPEEVYMNYKVDDVSTKNKKGFAKAEEYEEFTARPDGDGKMKDVEQGVPDEVVNEGSVFEDNMTDFGEVKYKTRKKASGGLAQMIGE